MGMFKSAFVSVLVLGVLWSLGSCTATVSPSGRQQKTIAHFSSRHAANAPTKQPVYQRYMNYNKKRTNKFKPSPRHHGKDHLGQTSSYPERWSLSRPRVAYPFL
jgi:hypothetical protein